MELTAKQIETKTKIELFARLLELDPGWALGVAMVESSLGEKQKSPTGARGVFQMTSIAMKDLLLTMDVVDDDWVDILCGLLFLRVLKKRWGSWEQAINHYCDPNDVSFYLNRVEHWKNILTMKGGN